MPSPRPKHCDLQAVLGMQVFLPRCGQSWGKLPQTACLHAFRLWKKQWTADPEKVAILPRRPAAGGDFSGKDEPFPANEAHLPAKRPPPQAQARLPGAHVDEG